MATQEELLNAALAYARYGWRVFPVLAGRKEPATAHGVKDATTDEVQIRAWWAAAPFLIGMACGPESGVFVVDVDYRNGGEWSSPVNTLTAQTGGRYTSSDGRQFPPGKHYFFKWPAGVAKMRPTLRQGVDVQGAGKYVILAPSETDAAYCWVDFTPPADAPASLLAEVAIAEGATTDTRPGDRFNEQYTIAQILEPLGWRVDHEQNGEVYWTRPGKDEGVSATENYADSGLFYVFSTSTGLDPERGYDAFGLYAALYHGGDTSAAAKALAQTLGYEGPRLTAGSQVAAAQPLMAPPTDTPSPAATLLGGRRESYTFQPAVHVDHFVDQFMRYAASVTDAPFEFTEAAALSMLAVVSSGIRLSLAHVPGGLRTNLYLCLVAPSTLARKSTVQQLATSMLAWVRPNSLLPDRMTTESAINELGQRAVAIWTPDEMGLALQQIYRAGSYSAGMEELLLTLYSGQTYRYITVTGGERLINGVDLNVLGASTPESLGANSQRSIGSGLLPRFGVVYPNSYPLQRPPVSETEAHIAARDYLRGRLRQVLELCTAPGAGRTVVVSYQALAVLSGLDQELGGWAMTARLVTAAYKVAALVALGDLRMEVTEDDAEAAVHIVRRWAEGSRNLRHFLGRSQSDVAVMEQVDSAREELRRVLSNTQRGPDGRYSIEQRLVARTLRLPHTTLRRIRDTLETTGELIVVTSQVGDEWRLAI